MTDRPLKNMTIAGMMDAIRVMSRSTQITVSEEKMLADVIRAELNARVTESRSANDLIDMLFELSKD